MIRKQDISPHAQCQPVSLVKNGTPHRRDSVRSVERADHPSQAVGGLANWLPATWSSQRDDTFAVASTCDNSFHTRSATGSIVAISSLSHGCYSMPSRVLTSNALTTSRLVGKSRPSSTRMLRPAGCTQYEGISRSGESTVVKSPVRDSNPFIQLGRLACDRQHLQGLRVS
jgi:hypothetical protein